VRRARSSGSVITVGRGVGFRLMSSRADQQSFSLCARLTAITILRRWWPPSCCTHKCWGWVAGVVAWERRAVATRRAAATVTAPVEHLKRGCGPATRTTLDAAGP